MMLLILKDVFGFIVPGNTFGLFLNKTYKKFLNSEYHTLP